MKMFMFSFVTIIICVLLFRSYTTNLPIKINDIQNSSNLMEYSYIESTLNQAELTEDDAIKLLFKYLYPEEDYFSLTTRYYVEESYLYSNFYAYEFSFPSDEDLEFVQRVESYGLSENGRYYIFGFYTDNYAYNGNGIRNYSHSNFNSDFAVNKETREIIQERKSDEGIWIYNENYQEIFK